MRVLRWMLDKQGQLFSRGPLKVLYPLHEALDTFLYTPGKVTKGATHVRDALDLKRTMMIVVLALVPCVLMAIYNTGLQANMAIASGAAVAEGWRFSLLMMLGLTADPTNILACSVHGALYYLPVLLVTFTVGGAWEALFAIVRKHEINEGFLVTGMLFPLICPPTAPLWQVALGISFGVVIGKEVFGGTGMNFLNPALTARCFLFFAYPQNFSGDLVWVAGVDGYSSATLLAVVAENGLAGIGHTAWSWWDAFWGIIPGSMGETSTAACIIGGVILLATKIASWRVIFGVVVGSLLTILGLNFISSWSANSALSLPFWWHFVLGGWAFGAVFMATDPVSSTYTESGKFIYGAAIGVLAILVRVVNPAFPEGMMLAILFMNAFAPLIDHVVLKRNIARRTARYAKL